MQLLVTDADDGERDALGDEVPPLQLSEPPSDAAGRWLVLGMVTSVDGAVAVDGTSRSLGGAGDLAAFRAVRALGDVVLVGLGTAVEERYRATWVARDVEARARRGQPPLPTLAIVSGSGNVPPDLPALDDPDRPPLLVTSEQGLAALPSAVRDRLRPVVVPSGEDDRLDLAAALDALADRGLRRVVAEGGPTLNAGLVATGRVDELFVTIAPALVGTEGPGIVGRLGAPRDLVLAELRVHGSELLCRYRPVRELPPDAPSHEQQEPDQ